MIAIKKKYQDVQFTESDTDLDKNHSIDLLCTNIPSTDAPQVWYVSIKAAGTDTSTMWLVDDSSIDATSHAILRRYNYPRTRSKNYEGALRRCTSYISDKPPHARAVLLLAPGLLLEDQKPAEYTDMTR